MVSESVKMCTDRVVSCYIHVNKYKGEINATDK